MVGPVITGHLPSARNGNHVPERTPEFRFRLGPATELKLPIQWHGEIGALAHALCSPNRSKAPCASLDTAISQ
jgi:hypothetical protein